MQCSFCATGTMGLSGNLLAGEILEQVVLASRYAAVRNVVFMGMGEPLDNYENVLEAVAALTDNEVFGLSSNHVTISTVRPRRAARATPPRRAAPRPAASPSALARAPSPRARLASCPSSRGSRTIIRG